MSMAAALSNVFNLDRQRVRDRFTSDRIDVEEPSDDVPAAAAAAVSSSSDSTGRRASLTRRRNSERDVTAQQQQQNSAEPIVAAEEGRQQQPQQEQAESTARAAEAEESSITSDAEESAAEAVGPEIDGFPILSARTTMTLAELEEERELARRRSSVCILLAAFVLFRLWVLALQEGDVGLLLLCLVGTSWTARWISYNREREEELDRRIANYLENSEPGATEVDRNELRMLSFQAQLALAIMESQRQMMQGGYGNSDGEAAQPGVSDEARSKWDHFKYKDEGEVTKGKYGSVSQKDATDDGPHCSICLSEYENGDDIVQLPCTHLYHDECIASWTSNHVKCPLCNFDLESVSGSVPGSLPPSDSIV